MDIFPFFDEFLSYSGAAEPFKRWCGKKLKKVGLAMVGRRRKFRMLSGNSSFLCDIGKYVKHLNPCIDWAMQISNFEK